MFKDFMCRHGDNETKKCDDNFAKALAILEDEYFTDGLTYDSNKFIHIALAYLGGVEIHGDMWFAVMDLLQSARTYYIECDNVGDGLARAIVYMETGK